MTCKLELLQHIRLHAVERGTVQLEFAALDREGVKTISRKVTRSLVLVFVSHAERSNFVTSLNSACSKCGQTPQMHADWLDPIPTSAWMRFDAIRWPSNAVLARGAPRVLLLNTQRRILNFVKSCDVPPGTTVPGNATIEQMVGLNPGRVLLERSSSDETRVVLCTGCSGTTDSIHGRLKSTAAGLQVPLQFASHGERERFCAYISQAVAPAAEQHAALASLGDVAALALMPTAVAQSLASASLTEQVAVHGEEASSPSSLLARRNSSATRARQTASTLQAYSNTVGSLYGREWPHQPVSVAVATFNAGAAPPPADSTSMQDWIPVPHSALLEAHVRSQRGSTGAHRTRTTSQVVRPSKDFDGTTDLYVVGMQELGGQRNRELWSAAVLGHINTSMARMAHSKLPLTKGASTMDFSSRPKAGGLTKAASLLDLREQAAARDSSESGEEESLSPQASAVFRTARSQTSATSALASARSHSDVPDTHRFVLVASEFMWELGIMVFVRASQAQSITGVVTSEKATGISLVAGKQLGNKGAVGVAFRWNGVQLSFINAHLAARPERVLQRNEHYTAVMQGLDLCTSLRAQQLGLTAVSEHTWFLGDLNYRVDLSFDDAHSACKELDFAKLSAADQLVAQMAAGKVLSGFSEGPLEFLPTYRWERNSDFISYKRGQAPSYTDRILHQSLPGVADKLSLMEYTSAPQYYGSDHRPVRALYELSLRRQYLPPPPLLTHTLIPFPTFFSRVDSLFGPVPVVQLQELQVSGFSALHAPGVMFLSLYAPGLLQSHDPPACSAAVAARGVSAEQAAELVQLKGVLHKEEKERRAAQKRAMKMQEASQKAMHKAKAAELKVSRTTPLGHLEGLVSTSFHRYRTDSVDGDQSDSDEEETTAGTDLTAFSGIATTQATGMARSDSMSVADPNRLLLLGLTCEYSFPDGVAPVCPALWDPRVLSSSHLIVAAHRAVISQDGQVASGYDVDHPIIASAAVPLRSVVDAAAAAITMSSMLPSSSTAQLPGRHRNSTMQVTSFAKTFDEHGVPLPLRCEAVPFSAPLLKDGVQVAVLKGKVALRASTQPGVKEFLMQQADGGQWLGSETHFADSLKSLVSLIDDMQDAVLSPASASLNTSLNKGAAADVQQPSALSNVSTPLASVSEGSLELGGIEVEGDLSAAEGIEAPTRRISVEQRQPPASAASHRFSKRGSILALHQPSRNPSTGAVIPMSRLASTAMLSPALPSPHRLGASDLKRPHSRTASIARPASKSATIAASSGSGEVPAPPMHKTLQQPRQTRRNGSVARRSLAIPSNTSLTRSAVTLPSDANSGSDPSPKPLEGAAGGEDGEGTSSSRLMSIGSEHSMDSSRTASTNSNTSTHTKSRSSSGGTNPSAGTASGAGRGQATPSASVLPRQPPPNKPSPAASTLPHGAKAVPHGAKAVLRAAMLPPPPAPRPHASSPLAPTSDAPPTTTTAEPPTKLPYRGHLKLPGAASAVAPASASSAEGPSAEASSPHSSGGSTPPTPGTAGSLVLPSGRTRRLIGKTIVRTSGKPAPPSTAAPAFAKPAVPPPKPLQPRKPDGTPE